MSFLGLDIGTSGCKAAIFEQDRTMLSSAYLGYQVINPEPGFAELDSRKVMDSCFQVIKKAVSESRGTPVKGLAISSQGEAFTPVGGRGEIIGNGMISSDNRAADLVEELSAMLGKENLYAVTGHTPYAMFSLFKLYWLKKNRPDLWQKSKAFYCYEDLMHLKLGLKPAISWPLAGRTMLFDVKNHQWDEEILQTLELNESRLAKPMPTGSCVGEIPQTIAGELGLNPGVKVYTGGHDQTVGAFGAGVTEDGSAMYATGTVECICPVFSEPHSSEELFQNNLCCYDFTLPNKYTTVAYSLTGGNILQWFKNEFGQPEVMESETTGKNPYELLLQQIDDAPTDLLVLPYFTPTGTPYFDPNAKGAILGLSLRTTRTQILKALLEGVALEMRLNIDIMERSGMTINKFIATGGGARSKKWVQLKADILNKPISIIEIDEAGCFGAAMIACATETDTPIPELIAGKIRITADIIPDPEKSEIYHDIFAKYRQLYPALRGLYGYNYR